MIVRLLELDGLFLFGHFCLFLFPDADSMLYD